MPEIRLNCLVVPDNIQAEKITRQHLLTINIDTQESVHALRSKIKKECAPVLMTFQSQNSWSVWLNFQVMI